MAYDNTLILDHIEQTHNTELLSEREKHLIGLAVTMTRGCQICTRNRVKKARSIGLTDDEINALIAVTSAVNSGVCCYRDPLGEGIDDGGSATALCSSGCGEDIAGYSPELTMY